MGNDNDHHIHCEYKIAWSVGEVREKEKQKFIRHSGAHNEVSLCYYFPLKT